MQEQEAPAAPKPKIFQLDSRREQNVGIVLNYLKLPVKQAYDALIEMDEDTVTRDVLEAIISINPTPEEVEQVKEAEGIVASVSPSLALW